MKKLWRNVQSGDMIDVWGFTCMIIAIDDGEVTFLNPDGCSYPTINLNLFFNPDDFIDIMDT